MEMDQAQRRDIDGLLGDHISLVIDEQRGLESPYVYVLSDVAEGYNWIVDDGFVKPSLVAEDRIVFNLPAFDGLEQKNITKVELHLTGSSDFAILKTVTLSNENVENGLEFDEAFEEDMLLDCRLFGFDNLNDVFNAESILTIGLDGNNNQFRLSSAELYIYHEDVLQEEIDTVENRLNLNIDSELSVTSTNPVQNKVITVALNDKASTSHTHTKSDISDFPNIPSKTSDLTNDGDGSNVFVKDNDSRLSDSRTPTSHTHGQITNAGALTSSAVTVASGDYILITDASNSNYIRRVANLLASHIKDGTAHSNIGSSANATQATINAAIDTKIGEFSTALDWQEYKTISASTFEYKILYNHTFAKLTYWTTDTQNQTTSWVNYGSSLLSDEWIRPTQPIIIFESSGDMAIRVNNDKSQLSHRSMTGSSWTASGVYVEGYWVHRGVP